MHRRSIRRKHSARWQELEKNETGLPGYTDTQLMKLQQKLAGYVLQAGEPGYNDDRMGFMHTYQHFPQLIIHCVCESDVVAAVKFARKRKLHVTTRSGGHSTAGYSVNDQIVIDTSAIAHVLVDVEAKRARVGPGTNFGTLNRMLDSYDLHVPGGGCETVCVAGYMQGGGFGFTSRLFGMNCDLVHSVRVVTAEGKILYANETENSDLYWAVRGGTGNQFGVLVEIEYNLVPLKKLTGFGLRFGMKDEAEIQTVCRVLEDLQKKYTKDGPPKLGLQVLMVYVPTAKKPKAQKPCLLVRGVYDGTKAECQAAIGPLLDHVRNRKTQVEIFKRDRYLKLNEVLLQTANPPGLDLPNVSMNTKPLVDSRIVAENHTSERWREVVDVLLSAPDKTCFVALELYGGAINEMPGDATAFVHRDASLNLFAWAFWTFEAHRDNSVRWLDKFAGIAQAMGNGRRYQNYPRRGDSGYLEQYFGDNLERLVKAKQTFDPHNLFAFEQSIPSVMPPVSKDP